ncbi:MAG: ABC transporter permease, partial [Oscillospiraceae bacterium]|nr:ABC transporter permease [Oscillospiraceae bacterium]
MRGKAKQGRKLEAKGWQKVMWFTFVQTVKAKTFITGTLVTILIFGIMISLANFLPVILRSEPELDEHGNVIEFKIRHVLIVNESGLDVDFDSIGIEYELIEASADLSAYSSRVTESDEATVLAVITRAEFGFEIAVSRPESTELIGSSDCFALIARLEGLLRSANLINLGVEPDDVPLANAHIHSTVNVGGEDPKSEIGEVIAMVLMAIFPIILLLLLIIYGGMTAQTIATEKSSRVMELLLTSIQPLAVVIGKVLASVLVVMSIVVVVGGTTALIFVATAPFGVIGEITGVVETADPNLMAVGAELDATLAGFSASNIFAIVVIFLLGFLFFSLISALIGASVNKIEDLQTASQPLQLVASLGFYLAYIPAFFGGDSGENAVLQAIVTASYYLPISSPFALPAAILTGEITGGQIALSISVLALCLVVFAIFVAKVYEHLILHNGDRVKFKDMMRLLKNAKTTANSQP